MNSGLNLLPKSIKCPPSEHSHSDDTRHGLSGGAIAAIILVIVAILAVIGFLWGYNKRRKEPFVFPWKKDKTPVYDDNYSTALDEDLLEEKEPVTFDDDGNEGGCYG